MPQSDKKSDNVSYYHKRHKVTAQGERGSCGVRQSEWVTVPVFFTLTDIGDLYFYADFGSVTIKRK